MQHSSAVSGRFSYPGTSASPQKSVLGNITEALQVEEEDDVVLVLDPFSVVGVAVVLAFDDVVVF